jgi:hypothetical protein
MDPTLVDRPRPTTPTQRPHPTPPRPTEPSPVATRRGLTGSSTDAKLLIELSCEVGDIWQRSAIHSSDRNCTAEAARPEGTARPEQILHRATPDTRWRPLVIEQVQHLTPGHPGQHLLVQRRRTPNAVVVLEEQVPPSRLSNGMRPSLRSEERHGRFDCRFRPGQRGALHPLMSP